MVISFRKLYNEISFGEVGGDIREAKFFQLGFGLKSGGLIPAPEIILFIFHGLEFCLINHIGLPKTDRHNQT